MFKQVEYSEILFESSLRNFGRCAHDGSSIGNEPPYRSRLMYISVVSDSEQLTIFFKLVNLVDVPTTKIQLVMSSCFRIDINLIFQSLMMRYR